LFWSDRDPDGRGFAPLADAYRRAGDAKQALELLGDGMDRHPDFAPGHVVAARLYVEQGLFTEAEIAARRVLDLDPENVDALRSLVRALDEEGEAVEAAKMREQLAALELEPLEDDTSEDASPVPEQATLTPSEPEESEKVAPEAVSEEPLVAEETPDFEAFALQEPEATEDVDELDSLAFSEAQEELPDLGTSAPGEPALGEPAVEEEVMDFGALAPDEPEAAEKAVMDFGALAPDEPALGEPAVEEEVMDFGALAPDEPEAAEEAVMEFGALAPDEPEAVEEEVMDFGALAPDEPALAEPAVEEEVMDFGALAPDEPASAEPAVEEEVMGFDVLAPDEPVLAEQIQTRTMADLYVTQGLIGRAIDVYEHLVDEAPDDRGVRARLEELRAGGVESLEAEERDDGEVEALARDLAASGEAEHEVDTPFAWSEELDEQETDAVDGPSIGRFFEDLLSYERTSEPEES
jgi:tetratricopeptide (TPR) repeat protein